MEPIALDRLTDLDAVLTQDEILARHTVRQFVADKYLPIIGDHFEHHTFPEEPIPELGDLGVLGASIKGYGCAGVNAVTYSLILQELEYGDSGLRSFVSVQGSLSMYAIYRFGSEAQKQHWLPRMASGEVIGCFGLTEPDSGSDPGSMRTMARQDGDAYVLNGAKMWITNAPICNVAVVWAKLEEDDPKAVRGFLVERGISGFETRSIFKKMSLRASHTGEIILSDCRIPKDNLLPASRGLGAPLACLNQARFGIAWGALGAGRACFEAALGYAGERTVFGKPLAAFQLTQQKLADMATTLVQGRLVAQRLGTLKDAGTVHPVQVSLAKRANVRIAIDIARSARTILGANGVTLEYPVARHMANLESVLTYEGTEEVHTLILGKALTGVDAFA